MYPRKKRLARKIRENTQTERYKRCTRKRAFRSVWAAQEHRRHLGDRTLLVYDCEYCGDYHLGHDTAIIDR